MELLPVSRRKRALTLGRQLIDVDMSSILEKYGWGHLRGRYPNGTYCEPLFRDFGFETVDSLDNSSYENASIIHDMNKALPADAMQGYDIILDAGTTEHIFNVAQVYDNIIDLLSPGGLLLSLVPNNNMSGHGIYQFSPEFFMTICAGSHGLSLKSLRLARPSTDSTYWVDVNDRHGNGRNLARIETSESVYVISLAERVAGPRKKLVDDSPQQYSYEHIDWVR